MHEFNLKEEDLAIKSSRKGKIITLVTEAQAVKGAIFIPQVLKECRRCSLNKICVKNVREGVPYEIKDVRKKSHECPATGSIMRIVEVVPAPIKALVFSKHAIKGAVINYTPIYCTTRCPYKKLCAPPGLRPGDKVRIVEILGRSYRCIENKELTPVLLLLLL